jgi:hypothetical protein
MSSEGRDFSDAEAAMSVYSVHTYATQPIIATDDTFPTVGTENYAVYDTRLSA